MWRGICVRLPEGERTASPPPEGEGKRREKEKENVEVTLGVFFSYPPCCFLNLLSANCFCFVFLFFCFICHQRTNKHWRDTDNDNNNNDNDDNTDTDYYQEYSRLHIAFRNGHVDIIQEFIQHGLQIELHATEFHHTRDYTTPVSMPTVTESDTVPPGVSVPEDWRKREEAEQQQQQ